MKPFGNNRIQKTTNNLKNGISQTESDIKEYEQKIRKMRANNAFDQELLKKLRQQGYNRMRINAPTQYLVGLYGGPFSNEGALPDVGDRFDPNFDIDSPLTPAEQGGNLLNPLPVDDYAYGQRVLDDVGAKNGGSSPRWSLRSLGSER